MSLIQSTVDQVADQLPAGFSEAGICTADFTPWIELFCQIGGWQQRWQGSMSAAALQLWGLSADVTGEECFLSRPDRDTGGIRLFKLHGIEQQTLRNQAQSWDSGGIFDLDIRVKSVHDWVAPLQERGWEGISPQPVDWQFGELEVREWLTRGPEDVILALIQRLAPSLQGWDELHGLSHVFNSSQIVHDMHTAMEFYQAMGFKTLVDQSGPLKNQGGEVLGLHPDIAPSTPVRLVIMQPQGVMDGSIELLSFENPAQQGKNLAEQTKPWQLGLNLLRFPVADLDGFMQRLQSAGIPLAGGPVNIELPPLGAARFIAVCTADGSWLEFYQLLNNKPGSTTAGPHL